LNTFDEQVLQELFEAKFVGQGPHKTAYCVAQRDIEDREGNVWPKGTRLKIVMVSRFGDVGLTDGLQKTRGYTTRVMPDSGAIADLVVAVPPDELMYQVVNVTPDEGESFFAMVIDTDPEDVTKLTVVDQGEVRHEVRAWQVVVQEVEVWEEMKGGRREAV